ncbi:F0F1 ATP synthase subunit A [Candidatus Saccharibacteria bacterium]|nr:F0F1 ATP synthase subunit A [Candidatus Saccharibacteria bacterium]
MMMPLISRIASSSGIHVSLKADKVFEVGGITVTNSMLYGAIVALFMGFLLVRYSKKSAVKAKKGFVSILEMIVEFIVGMLEGTFGSKEKAYKYAPIFGTFFFFIIFSNLLGLLPFVGPGLTAEGSPLLRPFTADLNGTIAMSVFAIVTVQYLSIKAQGVKGHLKHYFSDKPLNPLNFFIGILEVFGEFTRILSLSLRLFLNTAVGEILVSVFTSLVLKGGRTPVAVIPIILFELLVAGIQAYVFTVLSATYLSLAIAHAHDDEHQQEALKVEELPDVNNEAISH